MFLKEMSLGLADPVLGDHGDVEGGTLLSRVPKPF
jgi:hypothetical protein